MFCDVLHDLPTPESRPSMCSSLPIGCCWVVIANVVGFDLLQLGRIGQDGPHRRLVILTCRESLLTDASSPLGVDVWRILLLIGVLSPDVWRMDLLCRRLIIRGVGVSWMEGPVSSLLVGCGGEK